MSLSDSIVTVLNSEDSKTGNISLGDHHNNPNDKIRTIGYKIFFIKSNSIGIYGSI